MVSGGRSFSIKSLIKTVGKASSLLLFSLSLNFRADFYWREHVRGTSTQRETAVKGTLPALSGSWPLCWSIEGSEGCPSWWTRKAHLRRLLGKATVRSTSHIPVRQKTTSQPRRCTSFQAGSVEGVFHKINQMLVTQRRTSFSNTCCHCTVTTVGYNCYSMCTSAK